jgi:hypothetical protein
MEGINALDDIIIRVKINNTHCISTRYCMNHMYKSSSGPLNGNVHIVT